MSLIRELMQPHVDAMMYLRGETVMYRRASGEGATITAVRARTEHDERTPEGMVISVQAPDWLIEVTEFEWKFGRGEEPHDDDVIEFAGHEYLVKPTDGEACFVRQQGDAMFRVHTKYDGKC